MQKQKNIMEKTQSEIRRSAVTTWHKSAVSVHMMSKLNDTKLSEGMALERQEAEGGKAKLERRQG